MNNQLNKTTSTMRNMKVTTIKLMAILMVGAMGFSSCKKNEGCTDPSAINYDPDAEKNCCCEYGYEVPQAYNFSPAVYTGQTVRLVLLKDLVTEITSGNATVASLNAIYENSGASYADIGSNKNLSGKVAAQEVKDSIQAWFADLEALGGSGYVRADGVDLKQMIEKTLMGAVFYNQAVSHYLVEVVSDDNSTVDPDEGTDMQHHWDEAFGYFGAARDYNFYTDAEIISPGEKNSDGSPSPYSSYSGDINPNSEKCFYYAQTAAKRDVGAANNSASSQTDYTKVLFDAWLKGRAAIGNSDYTARDEQIDIIKENWDNIIAATVVHYINDVLSELDANTSITTHWAEATGYLSMIQYNSTNKLGTANINTIKGYFGANPYANSNLENDLVAARDIIKNAYGFTDEQANNW